MSLGAIPFFYMICHGMIPGIAGRTSGRMQQKWCAADALSGYFANEPPKSRASAQHVRKCVSITCQEMHQRSMSRNASAISPRLGAPPPEDPPPALPESPDVPLPPDGVVPPDDALPPESSSESTLPVPEGCVLSGSPGRSCCCCCCCFLSCFCSYQRRVWMSQR